MELKLLLSFAGFNASDIRQWPAGTYVTTVYGGAPAPQGDIQAYNQTGSIAWPFLLVWGQTPPVSGGGALDVHKSANMSCIRANDAIPGGAVPGWVSSSTNTDSTSPPGPKNSGNSCVAGKLAVELGIFSVLLMMLL